MSESVTALTPNVETAEDFYRMGKQLSDIAIGYLDYLEGLDRTELQAIPAEGGRTLTVAVEVLGSTVSLWQGGRTMAGWNDDQKGLQGLFIHRTGILC